MKYILYFLELFFIATAEYGWRVFVDCVNSTFSSINKKIEIKCLHDK
jgi:hypothetical protein